eukprot:EG_transcript_9854
MTGSPQTTAAHADERPVQGCRFFSRSDFILTVGEDDFAFAVQLARIVGGANLLATTLCGQAQTLQLYPQALAHALQLDLCGAIVNYNVDATTRKTDWDLQFDKIVFNFPESTHEAVSEEETVLDNQYLLAAFLYESARMLMPHGQIYISIKKGHPFDEWNLRDQAERCPYLELVEVVDLPDAQYPRYQPLVTGWNQPFALEDCELYIFQLRDEYTPLAENNNLRSEPHHPPVRSSFSRNGHTIEATSDPTARLPATRASPPPLAPRSAELIKTFHFHHIHDKQGIMYYLGLKAGNFLAWMNPVQAGLVAVRASSIKKGSPNGVEVGDHVFSSQVFFTDNVVGSNVVIDFSPCEISPNYYAMAHRAGVPDFFVRSWLLQGSADGVTWHTLRRHANDLTLNSMTPAAAWPVDAKGEFYRQFRVALEPRGNSRSSNALVLSCFEVYGQLRDPGGAP